MKSPALFVLATTIPVAVAEELAVVYPSFVVDDRVIKPREIRFHLKRHVQFMAPINCQPHHRLQPLPERGRG